MKRFLILFLPCSIFSVHLPDLQISKLNEIETPGYLYQVDSYYHAMLFEDVDLKSFKNKVAVLCQQDFYRKLSPKEPKYYQNNFSSPQYTYYDIDGEGFQIAIIPSHEIYLYWNADNEDSLEGNVKKNFRQKEFQIQLFRTPLSYIWETYSWLTTLLSSTEVRISRKSFDKKNKIVINNNYRDSNYANEIHLSYGNSLKYVGLKQQEGYKIRYFVNPHDYHIDIRSTIEDKCRAPTDLEQVKIVA